jgi:hypothetical protein
LQLVASLAFFKAKLTVHLWTQEIKPLFNSMKTLIIVFEIAMYSLELEIKLRKIKFIYNLPYIFTTLAETQHFLKA